LEPTEHTGVLATYKFSDMITAQLGGADTMTTGPINQRSTSAFAGNGEPETAKTLVSLLSFTAPDSWGFVKGSSLYAGADWGQGPSSVAPGDDKARVHLYLGGTLNTPIKDLTLGGAFDYVTHEDEAVLTPVGPSGGFDTGHAYAVAGYLSYKVTDKLTLNGRAEYSDGSYLGVTSVTPDPAFHEVFALTGTVQYSLWDNVISRLEARWDRALDGGTPFGGTSGGPSTKNEVLIAANIIYKF
jgi:hypothetical protein